MDSSMERVKGEQAQDAIEEAIAWSTVGIVSGSGEKKWQGIGTGTVVCWENHRAHVILTAEHVIRDTRVEDLRFVFRPRQPLQRVERREILTAQGAPTASLEPIKEIGCKTPIVDAQLDLAVIPVDPSLTKQNPVEFFELATGGITPKVGEVLIAMGYPFDISRLTTKNERIAFSSVEWTEVAANPSQGFDPGSHLVAPYHMKETDPAARPQGFSGAAFWYRRGATPEVWHPNLDVAGVIVEYYPRLSLLKAVRREVVEAFLTKHLG